MGMKVKKQTAPIGRPRAFDADRALDRALEVFWRRGYEGASLSELTEAMGINRPSLYAAFGDKESLFRRVLDRYAGGPAGYTQSALDAPTARAAVERLLEGAIELLSDPHHPQGCLLVQGALTCGEGAGAVRRELAVRRAAGEAALRRRLDRARREGDLPRDARPGDLASFFAAVIHGMAVAAAGGADRRKLKRIAQTALSVWPDGKQEMPEKSPN